MPKAKKGAARTGRTSSGAPGQMVKKGADSKKNKAEPFKGKIPKGNKK